MLYAVTFGRDNQAQENNQQIDEGHINECLKACYAVKEFKFLFGSTWLVETEATSAKHLQDLINPESEGTRRFKCFVNYVSYFYGWADKDIWEFTGKYAVPPSFQPSTAQESENDDYDEDIANANNKAGYQDSRYKIDFSHKKLEEQVDIEDLILDPEVRASITKLLNRSKFLQDGREAGFKLEDGFQNILFSGPQGIGKTTLAKAVARQYAITNGTPDMPIYFIESKDLIPRYTGQAANNTAQLLYQAKDGIIIFDEIDSLLHDDDWYGPEILNTLNAHMGNSKNKPIIYGTLYESQVENLFAKNRGLRKRFGRHFHMEGPSNQRLIEIFEASIKRTGIPFDTQIIRETADLLDQLKKSGRNNFAYIRDVKSIEDAILESLAEKYAKAGTFDGLRITLSDLPEKDMLGELKARKDTIADANSGAAILPFTPPAPHA